MSLRGSWDVFRHHRQASACPRRHSCSTGLLYKVEGKARSSVVHGVKGSKWQALVNVWTPMTTTPRGTGHPCPQRCPLAVTATFHLPSHQHRFQREIRFAYSGISYKQNHKNIYSFVSGFFGPTCLFEDSCIIVCNSLCFYCLEVVIVWICHNLFISYCWACRLFPVWNYYE